MLMFQADTAFALELIVLALGVFLLVWFRIHKEQALKRYTVHEKNAKANAYEQNIQKNANARHGKYTK